MNKDLIDFKIGTDAEFLCLYNGKIVNSNNYVSLDDSLGSDANGKTWEVRSKPSESPFEVVNSIKTIMQESVNNNPLFYEWKWASGSYLKNLPLGFHIHFGIKSKVLKPEVAIPYLDNYVGAISLLLEKHDEGANRRSYKKSPGGNPVSYGKMGDFRLKPHGFEYRPISSCISSPYVMTSLLCLAKAVMFEVLNNKSFKSRLLVEPDDFVNMNTAKITTHFNQIWQDITQLNLYPKYKKHIDFLAFLISNKDTWKQGDDDFKKNWGIINSSKWFKKEMPKAENPYKAKFLDVVAIEPVAIQPENDNQPKLTLDDIWGKYVMAN